MQEKTNRPTDRRLRRRKRRVQHSLCSSQEDTAPDFSCSVANVLLPESWSWCSRACRPHPAWTQARHHCAALFRERKVLRMHGSA